jgi:hypothetical protein
MNDNPPTPDFIVARPGHARILWATLFLCLLPFVIVSFFNFMSGDDYTLHANYHQHGFWTTQRIIYTQWTGRFTATFLGTLLMKFGWADHYYFLHTLLLFAGSWAAIFFLLSTANRRWLSKTFATASLALASSILLMIAVYVQPEIATGFYWFSAAVTYQTAFILFLLLAGFLIRRFSRSGIRRQWQNDAAIILLIILISGCNEVAAVALAFFLLTLIFAAYYYKRTVPAILLVYGAASLLTGMVILLTSGILSVRYGFMNSDTSVVAILPVIFFRGASVFYYILRVPLFWIGGFLLYMTGKRVAQNPGIGPLLIAWKKRKFLVPGLLLTPALILLTLTAVLLVSKGSLPDRALNNLVDLGAFCLLAYFFVAGAVQPAEPPALPPAGNPLLKSAPVSSPPAMGSPAVFAWALVLGLVANTPFADAWKSVFSGYFYHSINQDRRQKMEKARAANQKTVNLESYEQGLSEKIHRVFPHGIFATVNTMLKEQPTLLFMENGSDTPDHGWLDYYHLDSVHISRPAGIP